MTGRPFQSRFAAVRGLRYHMLAWGEPAAAVPPLVLVHGWMDVGASFQFVVDALQATAARERWIVAPDWRGFGLTDSPPADSYWFPDYLGDLDALLDALGITVPIDLVGHSMGGNIAMSYAGVRPQRIRRLVNLEGFGMPHTEPAKARVRLAQWLDSLQQPQAMRDYATLDDVAARLLRNNPRLAPDKARWLAPHWSAATPEGRYRLLGDPAHKRPNPVLYRVDETLETWKAICAPLLWVEGADSNPERHWHGRYSRAEFHQRLAIVPQVQREALRDCGHMLHHDQPEALARLLAPFLAG